MQSVANYSMIQITPRAVNELTEALTPEEVVRIAVRGGGCSGMSYEISIETEIDEEDILLDIVGVKIYIDPHSADILKNTVVDYAMSLQQQGFTFNNPDANTTCGCGASFS